MDPLEWQRLADEAATNLTAEIEALRIAYFPPRPEVSLRTFWPRARQLNERVRTAPAIKLDDKLTLMRALASLCDEARDASRDRRRRVALERQEISDRLDLAQETIQESSGVAQVHSARADLSLLRERLESTESPLDRRERQLMWHRWQEVNQLAWSRLNELWEADRLALSAILDSAQDALQSGSPRDARAHIRRFHTELATRECSHRALRALHARATDLWQQAEELARKKHAAYLAGAGQRLERWRSEHAHNDQRRQLLEREIANLEARAASASTGVAAALLKGQTESIRKELDQLNSADRAILERIESTQAALKES